jgi:DNA repair protein RecO (recombination protein O)
MTIFQSEGIVLQSIPFKERDRIITLFTKEGGMVKLFMKGKFAFQNGLSERFTIGDYLYSQGKGEMFRFCDGSVVEQNLDLRTSWEALEMGEKMCATILKSQWPEKEAPELYGFLISFLKKIPQAVSLETLWSAFLVKLMKHEGVLQLEPHCSQCFERVSLRHGGERFCLSHAPRESIEMTPEEEKHVARLYEERGFEGLLSQTLSREFAGKIEILFSQL